MSVIEWRAGTFDDPVARLRFLRLTMQQEIANAMPQPSARRHWRSIVVRAAIPTAVLIALVIFLPFSTLSTAGSAPPRHFLMARPKPQPRGEDAKAVWIVDSTPAYETYSNGLRIEKQYETAGQHRMPYRVYMRRDPTLESSVLKSGPAGIVYHTTESHLAPFEPQQNGQLRRIQTEVLDLVRRNRSYHYVVDRFGRVFRIVPEDAMANHAGISIWADDQYAYVNLNGSFLGVAFEGQSRPGEDQPEITSAQVNAARVLTDMLRNKYGIPAGNCVTHAQVSVNPGNMRIGYHTDWAANFPFREIGLGDNYEEPLASVYAFGFDFDELFMQSTGRRLWNGLMASEEQIRQQASALDMTIPAYKRLLRQRYEQIQAAQKSQLQKGESNEE